MMDIFLYLKGKFCCSAKDKNQNVENYLDFVFFIFLKPRPDASKIFIQVGFGFFVEFTLPEAVKFIDKKVKHLTE